MNEKMLYTLYTESRPNLIELISRYFDGGTVYDAHGIWQGETEPAAIIEIVATLADLQKAFDLAGDIREVNKQETVILTWQRINAAFIGEPEK